jgi:hypothetical protein
MRLRAKVREKSCLSLPSDNSDHEFMNSKTVIEQTQLRGSDGSDFLQKVATVYVDGDEYRVLAPPRAIGESRDWIPHFRVHMPDTESFNSEVVVEGVFKILAVKLVKEELERMKTNADGVTRRTGNRRTKLREMLDSLSNLRLCGPSDDPDEQTGVMESYRYLLINIKALSQGLISSDVYEQLEAVPNSLNSIYDVYDSKARLDAVCVDIESDLQEPTALVHAPSRMSLIASQLIADLNKTKCAQFDSTKLTGYCKEINSSFYHGNVVACLLLMRTVLNHVPPIFGYKSFAEVTANSGKSLRENLEFLENGVRRLADMYAHQPIRKTEQYPTKSQVEPYRAQLEVLLHEVLGRL